MKVVRESQWAAENESAEYMTHSESFEVFPEVGYSDL